MDGRMGVKAILRTVYSNHKVILAYCDIFFYTYHLLKWICLKYFVFFQIIDHPQFKKFYDTVYNPTLGCFNQFYAKTNPYITLICYKSFIK